MLRSPGLSNPTVSVHRAMRPLSRGPVRLERVRNSLEGIGSLRLQPCGRKSNQWLASFATLRRSALTATEVVAPRDVASSLASLQIGDGITTNAGRCNERIVQLFAMPQDTSGGLPEGGRARQGGVRRPPRSRVCEYHPLVGPQVLH